MNEIAAARQCERSQQKGEDQCKRLADAPHDLAISEHSGFKHRTSAFRPEAVYGFAVGAALAAGEMADAAGTTGVTGALAPAAVPLCPAS